MASTDAPFHPIIYVRGYAMTPDEIDATTADPFCGFNLGSTVYRATPDKDKPAKKFIFESPVIRLTTDFQYIDVFKDGLDITDPDWEGGIPGRSIVIYHYYEQASKLLGTGKTPEIETFARGLSDLVLRVRELVCRNPDNKLAPADFRCYLVAHSMGGLVCRAFLQNPELGSDAARRCVDKVFTYATPHNGIEMAGMNAPKWISKDDMNNFNRERMAYYLNLMKLYARPEHRVDWLPEAAFPSERFFCMVGTNRADYEEAKGLSRTFAGHGSDGLVRIENASVWGVDANGNTSAPCATAYTYRSHSGYFGIVNGEESYQNLTRFLFGDVRVDLWLDVTDVRLPDALQGKTVDALYQFEVLAAPRGKRWYLTRRTAEEDSVACRSHRDLNDPANPGKRSIYLSTVFLANRGKVDASDPALAYILTLGVRTPDYEIDRKFWFDGHYEGGYLFRDSVVIEMIPPPGGSGDWNVRYSWQSEHAGRPVESLSHTALQSGKVQLLIPFDSKTAPGIAGKLRFVVSRWNERATK